MNIKKRCFHTYRILLKQQQAKNLGGKKHSSQLWLTRQIKDPYVEMARQENYRCRSAYKLLEINERFKIFSPGYTVIDCGAAPGSWSQVAAKFTNATGKDNKPVGTVVALDRLPIHPIDGVRTLGGTDITSSKAFDALKNVLDENKADLVMSDMAPNASGIRDIDHDKIIQLVYVALKFALQISKINGNFLTKVWDGGKTSQLEKDLLKFYNNVRYFRPDATRDESTELYLLGKEFKGLKN